ncbi:MAG: FAD-binding protein, partial [Oscillospiraceae bacterium]|nr:FAD-binding protein [Oscillospiraceae bacterium]
QFHPTAFNPGGTDKEKFLISESVRGEGAYLLNNNYERFMHRYDERLELAPRDVVSKSIMIESRRTGANDFYLDIRHKGEAFLKSRFPGIYAGCLRGGVDMTKDLIPVFPCQHYLMGGIEVGMDSKTGVERLYAAGECACTGVHGKNRLASNSLLEGIVFGRRAAEDIKRCMAAGYPKASVFPCDNDYSGAPPPPNIKEEIRELMQRSYFVIPDEGAVRTGLRQAENILKRLKDGKYAVTTDYTEALTMAAMAVQILRDLGAGD